MNGIMPIIDLLIKYFDKLKRDANGTIVYNKRLKEISENLLKYEALDSTLYHTYDEFFNAVMNGAVAYDRQQKELSEKTTDTIPGYTNASTEEILSGFRILNESLCNSSGYIHSPERNIFELPKGCKSKYKYVSDVLTKEVWQFWKPGEQVFISAGTGRGKNTFIKKELLTYCDNQKVVIFENRQSLMEQQIIDIISEIDPEILKYKDISKENMVIFGTYKNIMIISYQCAALKCMLQDRNFLNFCSQAKYLVFDEAHYILDDSPYNKGISFFAQPFLGNSFQNAIKIFMSGTMEEFCEYVQLMNKFPEKPINIVEEKELLDEKGGDGSHNFTRNIQHNQSRNSVLSLPTDYFYIQPYKYKKIEDVCSQIARTPIDEKWLIFVKSIEDGVKLKLKLENICANSVCFLSAKNKNDDENKEIYSHLIRKCKFDCRVLIATTVIYNGINVKDNAVKHIVVPFATMSVVKQLIGRKRMSENETVNVYFPNVTYEKLNKRYRDCIKDCMEIIDLNANLQCSALCQLDGLVNSSPSKYYYLAPQQVTISNGVFATMMMAVLNYPAIYKLYYDTCFYIFALQRMDSKLKGTDFVKILLTHLNIEDKYDEVIDITIKTSEEKAEEVKAKFSEYLESLTGDDIISPDENGSFEKYLELKREINKAYKTLHDGKSLDTQWKNSDRFFSERKVQAFLLELDLPYTIQSESVKGKRITKIIRL